MATAINILLKPEDVGIMNFGNQSKETAEKTSELLQQNHNNHHVFFNASGFHNHIVHHLLTLYAVGAPSSVIQTAYDYNASYQRPPMPTEERVIVDMADPKKFKQFLGNEKYYPDFVEFFQRKIEEVGWEAVLKEFLWSGDERGDDLLVRMFSSLLHPIIHLGFGIEFKQPAIIAEALAQAAVHDSRLSDFYFPAEKAASTGKTSPTPTIVQLLKEIHSDKKLNEAAKWDDSLPGIGGMLARAPEEIIKYVSQWHVDESGGEKELEKRTAEMIQAAVWFTAGAQKPPKVVKFDFFFIHCVNASIFWPTFNALPFLTLSQKIRLLEWKVRTDLLIYASWASPETLSSEITPFIPKTTATDSWKSILDRVFDFGEDDSHIVKLVRAVRYGKEVSREYEGKGEDWVVVKGGMWEGIGEMAVKSTVEGEGARWVRGAGFEEAWKDYGDRKEGDVSSKMGALRL